MKKTRYIHPTITIVNIKVEHGFVPSNPINVGLVHSRSTYYSTGEDYTECTSDDGAFTPGEWI